MLTMSSTANKLSEDWLLVQLQHGANAVVHMRSVVESMKELKIGDALTLNRRGEQEAAVLVARAQEREELEVLRVKKEEAMVGPEQDEDEDFSASASDWVPSDDDDQTGDSDACDEPTYNQFDHLKRQYTKSNKKIMTPSNKVNAVAVCVTKRKRTPEKNNILCVPGSIAKRKQKKTVYRDSMKFKELREINNTFRSLFRSIYRMKMELQPNEEPSQQQLVRSHTQCLEENKENRNDNMTVDEELNRSGDNALISNKYSNITTVTTSTVRKEIVTKTTEKVVKATGKVVKATGKVAKAADKEWIPIGGGATLIHKDKFKKVNWKSYTIATRTLLLAAFPRRVLATHSLTGKQSPAFQNKPAKMCLDQRIIADVITEVTDRFNVRDNLVRSIITTKCADECKMWKMRAKKALQKGKGLLQTDSDDRENTDMDTTLTP